MRSKFALPLLSLWFGCLVAFSAAVARAQQPYRAASETAQAQELDRLLQSIEKQKKLDELAAYTRKAIQAKPHWVAGKVALVLIEVRRDKLDEAKAVLEELLSDKANPVPTVMAMVVTARLAQVAPLRPQLIRLLEQASQSEEVLGYRNSPAERLVALYVAENHKEEARQFLLRFADRRPPRNLADAEVFQLQSRLEIAKELEKLGYPLDAWQLCRRTAESVKPGKDVPANVALFRDQAQEEAQRLQQKLSPEALVSLLPEPSALPASPAEAPARPVVEFLLHVERSGAGEASLVSPVARALAATAERPELRQQARARLSALAAARPEELSIAMAVALLELASGTASEQAQAVDQVVALLEKRPLASFEAGRPMSDQERAEAAEQFPVSLVALACLAHPPLAAQSEKLSARALAASTGLPDPAMTSVMLAQLGPATFAHQDPQAVRKELLQVLQSYLNPFTAKTATASLPVSPECFTRVSDLAFCALEAGLPEVSAECLSRALKGGPPCDPDKDAATSHFSPSAALQVAQMVHRLDQRWREKKYAPAAAYELLAAIVLPKSPSPAIWLYAVPAATGSRSLGELLVERAIEAGKLDDLCERLGAYQSDSKQALNALILRLQIALTNRSAVPSPEAPQALLSEVAKRLRPEGTMETARLLIPTATQALRQRATRPAAEELVGQISAKLTGASAWGARLIKQTPVDPSSQN